MIGKKYFDKTSRTIWVVKEGTNKGVVLVSEDETMTRKLSYESFYEKVNDGTLYEITQ